MNSWNANNFDLAHPSFTQIHPVKLCRNSPIAAKHKKHKLSQMDKTLWKACLFTLAYSQQVLLLVGPQCPKLYIYI